jgi:hypothetical protein
MRSGRLGGVMTFIVRDYRRLVPIGLSVLAGLIALAAMRTEARAQDRQALASQTFIIPADDGYGTGDCLGKDKTCGEVVASAWCEAHGMGEPIAFGPASDITGATAGIKQIKLDPNSFVITCRD